MCTLGSPLWLHLVRGGETERKTKDREAGEKVTAQWEGAGTGDTPLEDLTGVCVPAIQAGFARGDRKTRGVGTGWEVRHLSPMPVPAAQTSVSDREPQAGVRKPQDWQRSPATLPGW